MLNLLSSRKILLVAGKDKYIFLQGLITSNIELLTKNKDIIYSLILNNKGRMEYDIYISLVDECFLLEYEYNYEEDFLKLLEKYRTNYDVKFVLTDLKVYFTNDNSCFTQPQDLVLSDPITNYDFFRCYTVRNVDCIQGENDYIQFRIKNNHPEGRKEILGQQVFDYAFDRYISREKGCYIGQEVLARIYSRIHVIKNKIVRVKINNLNNFLSGKDNLLYLKNKIVGHVIVYNGLHALVMLKKDILGEKEKKAKINLDNSICLDLFC